MLTSAMDQFGSQDQDIFFKKPLNMKRIKHATNFSLKLLNYFLEVRGFNPDILTLKRRYSTSASLLSVDSQHNNHNSVYNLSVPCQSSSQGFDT